MKLSPAVRTTILWTHLLTGCIVGIVVLIMSVTGVLLGYEKQMIEWADGYTISPPAPEAKPLPVETLLANVRIARPDAKLSNVSLSADPAKPASVRYGRKSIFVDPYTGKVLGEGNESMRKFMSSVRSWHRWIAASGDNQKYGKAITGASNLAFLFLVISGVYLWWPRRWTWKVVKPVLVPSAKLKGKPRDFNWHNSLGFWAAVPLFFIVLSGVFISYRWPREWTEKLLGSGVESREGGEGRPRGEGGEGRAGGERGEAQATGERRLREEGDTRHRSSEGAEAVASTVEGERRQPGEGSERAQTARREGGNERRGGEGAGRGGGGGEGFGGERRPPMKLPTGKLDQLVADAQRRAAGWKTFSFSLPSEGDKNISFTLNRSENPRPDTREQLKLGIKDGQFAGLTTYQNGSLARRLTSWTRYLHTGEVFGLFGQTIATLASLIGAVLVYTGLLLTWRRFRTWNKRRNRPERVAREQAVERHSETESRPKRLREPATV